ncbi:MAG: hypothetical protein J6J13_05295 [Clostridia bacterium]|nr:hypothetical protein [Clostridia bacterium]
MEIKLMGTKIYISFLFWALICFMIALDRTGYIFHLIIAVTIHEAAHLLMMWMCNCGPKSVRLIPASVQIVRSASRKKYGEELIAAAGPIANILVGSVFLIDFFISDKLWILEFALINFCTAAFNLLPVWGLDGGLIISCIISRKTNDPYKGERVVRIISLFFGAFFFFLGVFFCLWDKTNLSFFAIAIYLILSSLIKQ